MRKISRRIKEKILSSLKKAIGVAGFKIEKLWGEQIEDRGSQITFSALGQHAPLEEKEKWDPDFAKRKKIKAILDTSIPEFSVRIGGSTSIDITKPGIDKAYGIGKLRDLLTYFVARDDLHRRCLVRRRAMTIPPKKRVWIAFPVKGPDETKRVIQTIIACLADRDSKAA
jgi:phosphomannomutase